MPLFSGRRQKSSLWNIDCIRGTHTSRNVKLLENIKILDFLNLKFSTRYDYIYDTASLTPTIKDVSMAEIDGHYHQGFSNGKNFELRPPLANLSTLSCSGWKDTGFPHLEFSPVKDILYQLLMLAHPADKRPILLSFSMESPNRVS